MEFRRVLFRSVMSAGDAGRFEFLPFAVVPGEGGKPRVQSMNLRIVSGSAHRPLDGVDAVPAIFERVRGAYDLDWLAGCRVIAIGAGGANSWLDNMARTGVGEFVLVDPDTVEAKNVGTQRVYLSESGKPKVQVVCQRLLDINPEVKVLPLPALLDRIDDKMFARLALAPWDQLDNSGWERSAGGGGGPRRTLVCGLTDNFEAQARVNRLALQFGLPSLAAQGRSEAGR